MQRPPIRPRRKAFTARDIARFQKMDARPDLLVGHDLTAADGPDAVAVGDDLDRPHDRSQVHWNAFG